MVKTEEYFQLQIESIDELRLWLSGNYDQKESIWLVTFKKEFTNKYVSRWDVLDELICYGWIDGVRRKLDHARTMQLVSPRKAQHWAKSYKDRVEALEKEGRMHHSGLKLVEKAKKSGLWTFMDDVDQLIVPKDLLEELENHVGAKEFFESINPSSKRNALRWIKLAKSTTTRNKRINKLAELSSKGQKLPNS